MFECRLCMRVFELQQRPTANEAFKTRLISASAENHLSPLSSLHRAMNSRLKGDAGRCVCCSSSRVSLLDPFVGCWLSSCAPLLFAVLAAVASLSLQFERADCQLERRARALAIPVIVMTLPYQPFVFNLTLYL